jgi:predicted RNase H-like HicB family nuclease
MKIQYITQFWKEDEMVVAYVPQLDLSTCGKTEKEAKKNMQIAFQLFVEEAKKMGTLEQILEEAGFIHKTDWAAPEISSEKMILAY